MGLKFIRDRKKAASAAGRLRVASSGEKQPCDYRTNA
jgi:hypothetical protein